MKHSLIKNFQNMTIFKLMPFGQMKGLNPIRGSSIKKIMDKILWLKNLILGKEKVPIIGTFGVFYSPKTG